MDVFQRLNERNCRQTGFTITTDPNFKTMRYFSKGNVKFAVINKAYLQEDEILTTAFRNCQAIYIMEENDTVERIYDIYLKEVGGKRVYVEKPQEVDMETIII